MMQLSQHLAKLEYVWSADYVMVDHLLGAI